MWYTSEQGQSFKRFLPIVLTLLLIHSLNSCNKVSNCQIRELCFQSSTKQSRDTSLIHKHDSNSNWTFTALNLPYSKGTLRRNKTKTVNPFQYPGTARRLTGPRKSDYDSLHPEYRQTQNLLKFSQKEAVKCCHVIQRFPDFYDELWCSSTVPRLALYKRRIPMLKIPKNRWRYLAIVRQLTPQINCGQANINAICEEDSFPTDKDGVKEGRTLSKFTETKKPVRLFSNCPTADMEEYVTFGGKLSWQTSKKLYTSILNISL